MLISLSSYGQTNQNLNQHSKKNTDNSSEKVTIYLPISSQIYPDLTQHLEQALSNESINNIRVQHADFWHPYQQGLRKGRKGVYFAQPHFAAWVITKHNFKAFYKLHGKLQYTLAARRSNHSIFEINDLAGKVICREAGLNLGTVWLNSLLGKHQITANTQELTSIEQSMHSNTDQCDTFIVEDTIYKRINEQQRNKYIRLSQSTQYKQNAFVAHPDISAGIINQLKKAFKRKSVKSVLEPYFKDLSKWQNLQAIEEGDYGTTDTELLRPYWGED